MTRCTICGEKKGFLSGGWRECSNCGVYYCPKCYSRLKATGLVFKKKICVRCGEEL